MLSVIIIAKNEARTIAHCLRSIQWVDEIIVLDSGSTDDTLKIAREYTPHVYQTTDWQGYGIQKQRALNYATGTWVLNLDADEWVNDSLRKEIQQAMTQSSFDAYRIPIHLHFYGRSMKYTSWCPQRHIRMFRRLGAKYNENIVHEAICLPHDFKIGALKGPIQHDSFRDITHALSKMNNYSTFSATMRRSQQKTPSFLQTVLGACWMFFRCYFVQKGVLEGKHGFVLAVLTAQGSFYRNLKMLYPDQEREDNLP